MLIKVVSNKDYDFIQNRIDERKHVVDPKQCC